MPGAARRLTLVTMCLGAFVSILDASIVNLGLHSIQSGLHTSVSGLQWVVNLYNVTYAAFILTGGTLADLYGRKKIFIAGLVIFGAGSLVCALAPTAGILIAGRGIAGVGAALELPASLSILNVSFESDRERTNALAVWASAYGLGMAVGPTAGGLLVDHLGWRSLFWVIVPVVVVTIFLALESVPESSDEKGRKLDVPGQLLAAVALTALSLACIQGPSWGWGSPATIVAFSAAAAAIAGFIVVEKRTRGPMIPLDVFKKRPFSAAIVDATLMTFGNYAFLFIFPLYLQSVRGESPLMAGLALLPMSLSYFLTSSLVSGRLANHLGPRVVVSAGMAVNGLGIASMAFLGADSPFGILVAGLVAIGVGLGLMTGPINGAATANAPRARSGMSSGIVNVGRMVGATLGVGILGTLFSTQGGSDSSHFLAGMRAALLVGGIGELAGSLVAVLGLRRDSLRATG